MISILASVRVNSKVLDKHLHMKTENSYCAHDFSTKTICPSLIYLDFSCDDIVSPFVFTGQNYPSIKYLGLGRLKSFLFHDGKFDYLLSSI
jgi:hypothetical protein